MRAIITAAGRGSRLASSSDDTPKTLLPFGTGTILSGIMRNFAAAGISEFIVVVGFQGEAIVEYLNSHANLGHAVTVLTNPEWRRGNGISVHLGAPRSRRTRRRLCSRWPTTSSLPTRCGR